jgi:hypothetical protein
MVKVFAAEGKPVTATLPTLETDAKAKASVLPAFAPEDVSMRSSTRRV